MSFKKSHDDFVREIKNKFGEVYLFKSDYLGANKKIEVEHLLCGYSWNPLPSNLLQGKSTCPNCSGKKKVSSEEFNAKLKKYTNNEFELVGKFGGQSSKNYTTIKHVVCGNKATVVGSYFDWRSKIGCAKCSNMIVHDKDRVEMLLEDKFGTEYILLSNEVKNNRDIITILHNECGKEFETISNKIINQGSTCPYCNKQGSKGELKIEKILKINNIEFIREYAFDDCRHRRVLFFDFAIFDSNNSLLGLIEFDGKQHFEPIEFFGGIDGYELTKLRDEIKNKYCKSRNIPLLRIPYFKENELDGIINNLLIDYKLKDGDLVW